LSIIDKESEAMALGGYFGNFDALLKLAKDENFRKFLTHPKVQELMADPEFKRAVQSKDMLQLISNKRFTEIMKDPQVREALKQVNQKFKKN
jgi:hypothetical protein